MNNTLNRQSFGLIIGLLVQYALGMVINLFVEFPDSNNPHVLWDFTLHNPYTLAHLILGTLLILGATAMVVRAVRQGVGPWKLPAISGLIWVLVAWAAGDVFVATQADGLSYLMSLAFLLAILSYTFGLYRSRSTAPIK